MGIGLSAGGLEAISTLLPALPASPGAAFVVVQHLDPRHESQLATLLARLTVMPVQEVTDGLAVARNHVYVIPPNRLMELRDGRLRLAATLETAGTRTTIDHFFISLAREAGPLAMGVILSGTASDGTHGLTAIKGEGGFTFAQDEASAKYYGMPASAIATGGVDFVLPPADIAREIVRLSAHPYLGPPWPAADDEAAATSARETAYVQIVQLLKAATRIDFSLYKQTTLQRRIARRMAMSGARNPADYARLLQSNAEEMKRLHADLLINVTSFFRDPDAFEALKTAVLAKLAETRDEQDPIRICVAGCASGEEAYSILIALAECLGPGLADLPVQIFATDLSEEMVARARDGVYRAAALTGVSRERLSRFFTRLDDGFRIAKPLRDRCVFSKHNLVHDAPFSRMDLVSCRNLLIYLGAPLQKKALGLFHYALKPGGFLFLGSNETTSPAADLFEPVERHHRIFLKKAAPLHRGYALVPGAGVPAGLALPAPRLPEEPRARFDLTAEANRIVLERYVPAGVVVDEKREIVIFRGNTRPYLEHAPGQATLDVVQMARPGLDLALRKLLAKAARTGKPARQDAVALGEAAAVDVSVIPFEPPETKERYLQVLFEDHAAGRRPRAAPPPKKRRAGGDDRDVRIADLEKELTSVRAYLEALTREHEAASEDLRAVHEEALSANEELQSTNEELHTAGEELQSTNEELTTLNEEMENRNRELSELNDDHANLLASTRLPILFLARDLRIRKFTPLAQRVLNVIPSDAGRPIADLRGPIDVVALRDAILEVIASVQERRLEVADSSGRWFDLRILPYRTGDDRIDGAVLVFFDIDELKRAQQAIDHRSDELARANRDLEAFTTALSHDLAEPLRMVSSYVHLLQERYGDALGDEGRKFAGHAKGGADMMRQMIDGLLRLSRVETTGGALAPVDAGQALAAAVRHLQLAIREAGAVMDAAPALPTVLADEPQLVDVFQNLVANALRYRGTAPPRIRVEAQREGAAWRFAVRDNGIGVPPDQKERIFEMFVRSRREGSGAGAGVGLALVRRIVERHGGRVWVESEPGQGSTFYFTLSAPAAAPRERREREA